MRLTLRLCRRSACELDGARCDGLIIVIWVKVQAALWALYPLGRIRVSCGMDEGVQAVLVVGMSAGQNAARVASLNGFEADMAFL